MKTKSKTKTVSTWLPGFTGFYGSLWEDTGSEEADIQDINDQRRAKGLPPVDPDVVEFDYKAYFEEVAEDITSTVGNHLRNNGFITDYDFEKLVSPHEYNFKNDSIDVRFKLTKTNEEKILAYLQKNMGAFEEYISDRYTSRSGFASHYPGDAESWLIGDVLTHEHKLGAVLDFILRHSLLAEGTIENIDDCVDGWLYENCEAHLFASNYHELIEGKEAVS